MGKTTDILFRIGLITKGVDAVFEVVGGVLLTMPTRLARYIAVISEHEVYRHHQALAGKLDNLAQDVSTKASMGEAVYLMIHGLAKVILILAIVRGFKWGYVGLIGVLSIFTVIETVRAVTAHEILTGVLGLFDLVVVVLIYVEYKKKFLSGPPSALSGEAVIGSVKEGD